MYNIWIKIVDLHKSANVFCSLETKPSWALVRDGELFRCSPVFQGVYVWWYSWPSMTMIINYHQLSSIIQHISNIYPTYIQHISNIYPTYPTYPFLVLAPKCTLCSRRLDVSQEQPAAHHKCQPSNARLGMLMRRTERRTTRWWVEREELETTAWWFQIAPRWFLNSHNVGI